MSKYGYEAFEDEQIEEILENIKDGFYQILENHKYGEYLLNITQENEIIIIEIFDDKGSGRSLLEDDYFITIVKNRDFQKFLDAVLYYRYHEYE